MEKDKNTNRAPVDTNDVIINVPKLNDNDADEFDNFIHESMFEINNKCEKITLLERKLDRRASKGKEVDLYEDLSNQLKNMIEKIENHKSDTGLSITKKPNFMVISFSDFDHHIFKLNSDSGPSQRDYLNRSTLVQCESRNSKSDVIGNYNDPKLFNFKHFAFSVIDDTTYGWYDLKENSLITNQELAEKEIKAFIELFKAKKDAELLKALKNEKL